MRAKTTYYISQEVGSCIYLGEEVLIGKRVHAKFKCRCGNYFIGDVGTVASNSKKYCSNGCELKKMLPSNKKPIHGQTGTTEYRAWKSMRDRCTKERNKDYFNYGGRGITISQEWLDFNIFFKDMGFKPTKDHSLDRYPDVNGNYCKENCRWATSEQQNRNRRDNVNFIYNGEEKCASEWAREFNISLSSLRRKLSAGEKLSPELKNTIKAKEHFLSYNGFTKSVTQWAKDIGIKRETLFARIKKEWSVEKILTEPVKNFKNKC